MGIGDDGLAEVFGADTFLVIGDDESVEPVVEGVVDEASEFDEEGIGEGRIVIEIESEDLMIFSDDESFSGSGEVGEEKTARIDVKLEE